MANAITTMTAVLQMNNTKFKKGIDGSKKQLTAFQKQVQTIKRTIGAAFAIGAVTSFARSSFEALDTQRKAEAALLTALKGKSDIQRSLIQQAKELQKVTLFGDEETIRAQSLIAAFTNEEQTIKRLIPLVQDFATAKQMSLAGAADLVSKTIGSSTNALSRYGISVTGAVGSTERLDSLVRGLTNAFYGQAKAAAEADTSLTRLKNEWGDFKEFAASMIVPSNNLKDLAGAFKSEDIKAWDKFLALFDPVRAATIAAIASNLDDIRSTSPGGAAGFFGEGGGTTEPPLPSIKGIMGMGSDAEIEDFISGLTWIREKGMLPLGESTRIAREEMQYLKGILANTAEDIYASAGPAVNMLMLDMDGLEKGAASMTKEGMGLGKMIADSLINQFDQLGYAIGQFASGAEGAFKSLGETIMQNLGNILIMMAAQMGPAGLPLLLAGIGLQLGGGILKGLGNKDAGGRMGTAGSDTVKFQISGQNLVGVLERQNNMTGRFT